MISLYPSSNSSFGVCPSGWLPWDSPGCYVTGLWPVMLLSLLEWVESASGTIQPTFSHRLGSCVPSDINPPIPRICAFVHPCLMMSGSRSSHQPEPFLG